MISGHQETGMLRPMHFLMKRFEGFGPRNRAEVRLIGIPWVVLPEVMRQGLSWYESRPPAEGPTQRAGSLVASGGKECSSGCGGHSVGRMQRREQ